MRINKKLMTLYPTKEVMANQREKYRDLNDMARKVGVSPYSLNEHRKFLKLGNEPNKKQVNILNIPESEIYNNIKELVGSQGKNVVNKYKIVDAELFWQNQRGYAGLEFIGTFNGSTWKEASNLMPNCIGGRGQHE